MPAIKGRTWHEHEPGSPIPTLITAEERRNRLAVGASLGMSAEERLKWAYPELSGWTDAPNAT